MTRRRRTPKEAEQTKMLLADIIQSTFDNNGQVISHDDLAKRHVLRNASVSAAEDVALYGGPAVVYLRKELGYAIVPITSMADVFINHPNIEADPNAETIIANSVAGVGAGGIRTGWYQPRDEDDWLWVFYIGHLTRAGVYAVFHAGNQVNENPTLVSDDGVKAINSHATANLPAPATGPEKKMLAASSRRK